MMLSNDDIEDLLRHKRKDDHRQCADDGAGQHAGREQRISLQISKDAPDRLHSRLATRRLVPARQVVTVKFPHSLTYTRSLPPPRDLCRSLNVSSAIPDLSSSPKPSAIIRSYCSLVARASGNSRPSWHARS